MTGFDPGGMPSLEELLCAAAAAVEALDDEARTCLARAITIFDYVRSAIGDKPVYTGEDHWNAGVAVFGRCEICLRLILSLNAYPARSGYCRCTDCIGDDGYASVEEFGAALTAALGDNA